MVFAAGVGGQVTNVVPSGYHGSVCGSSETGGEGHTRTVCIVIVLLRCEDMIQRWFWFLFRDGVEDDVLVEKGDAAAGCVERRGWVGEGLRMRRGRGRFLNGLPDAVVRIRVDVRGGRGTEKYTKVNHLFNGRSPLYSTL